MYDEGFDLSRYGHRVLVLLAQILEGVADVLKIKTRCGVRRDGYDQFNLWGLLVLNHPGSEPVVM